MSRTRMDNHIVVLPRFALLLRVDGAHTSDLAKLAPFGDSSTEIRVSRVLLVPFDVPHERL